MPASTPHWSGALVETRLSLAGDLDGCVQRFMCGDSKNTALDAILSRAQGVFQRPGGTPSVIRAQETDFACLSDLRAGPDRRQSGPRRATTSKCRSKQIDRNPARSDSMPIHRKAERRDDGGSRFDAGSEYFQIPPNGVLNHHSVANSDDADRAAACTYFRASGTLATEGGGVEVCRKTKEWV